jgi:predicted DCC family thiol-disulfide oxidoreductase YuxK
VSSSRPVLLYDGACRFCRFVARAAVRLDRGERIAFLPLQDSEATSLLPGLDEAERMASIHLVEPDGRRFSRGAALSRLITHLRLPHFFARLLGRAYDPIARRRNRLGRAVPDGRAPRRYP